MKAIFEYIGEDGTILGVDECEVPTAMRQSRPATALIKFLCLGCSQHFKAHPGEAECPWCPSLYYRAEQ